ncbi:cytochrome P450 [Sporodiniella umbellata]|nr:cytochrome P450 [Sporodiniella umbellata]
MHKILCSIRNLILENSGSIESGRWLTLGLSGVVGYCLFYNIVYRLYLGPLSKIPGPRVSWIPFMGNFFEVMRTEIDVSPFIKWTKEYGGIFVFHHLWNEPRVVVTDEGMVKQITTSQAYSFRKPDALVKLLRIVSVDGIITAEGEKHRKQRKMLSPAFSVAAVRGMVSLMLGPATTLCDQWKEKIKANKAEYTDINVSEGISLAALDIIGMAAFGQDLNCLKGYAQDQMGRLPKAYMQLSTLQPSFFQVIKFFFPLVGYLPIQTNRKNKLSLKWLSEDRDAMIEDGAKRHEEEQRLPENQRHKDLLSLMFRLVDEDDGKKLTKSELKDQCLSFLAAGHDTTSSALSWCLWLLAQNPEMQDRVRSETKTLFEQNTLCDYHAINALPYLDCLFRETLRLIPVVPRTLRTSCVPVTLGPYVIPKNTTIHLSPLVTHISKEIWGEDAHEFNPSRWVDGSPLGNAYQYFPFMSGVHQCLGQRFATVEFKLLLIVWLKDIEFSLTPGFKIEKKQIITTRPIPNMTLRAKLVKH